MKVPENCKISDATEAAKASNQFKKGDIKIIIHDNCFRKNVSVIRVGSMISKLIVYCRYFVIIPILKIG